MDDSNALNVYTDGSASKWKGGIGVRFIFPDSFGYTNPVRDFNFPGYTGGISSDQMELKACIKALEEILKMSELTKINRIVIYSDCLYLVSNFKNALFFWSQNKWKLRSGAPVMNMELWKEICRLTKKVGRSLDIKVTPHRLRHTAATLKLNEGVPIESVSKVLGHSEIRTTGIYARVLDKSADAALNALASLVEGSFVLDSSESAT